MLYADRGKDRPTRKQSGQHLVCHYIMLIHVLCNPPTVLVQFQIMALQAVYSKRDTFCMLPTGFGKSLIFQMTPFLMGEKTLIPAITLVISPLNSIIQDQVRRLCAQGVLACSINMEGKSGETFHFKSAGCKLEKVINN